MWREASRIDARVSIMNVFSIEIKPLFAGSADIFTRRNPKIQLNAVLPGWHAQT